MFIKHNDVTKKMAAKTGAGSSFGGSIIGGVENRGSLNVGEVAKRIRNQRQNTNFNSKMRSKKTSPAMSPTP